ncbi:hypothetical protein C7444_11471 [Sphaerotilus hippei]|uniref:Uncharacterized protein n=1 Tax=Sphaerotilus hippei TaxID=744406 RepID=A0A318GXR7_9BURK|nr:hypothetical protein [Sphaerotilus hippei]PXW94372.1 hypothetical protein C7444_11471 [Sphaerotilus hippei]
MSRPVELIKALFSSGTEAALLPMKVCTPPAAVLGLPFDALRAQYAWAVRAGLVERSLLASSRFERQLAALEQMAYGPFARRV